MNPLFSKDNSAEYTLAVERLAKKEIVFAIEAANAHNINIPPDDGCENPLSWCWLADYFGEEQFIGSVEGANVVNNLSIQHLYDCRFGEAWEFTYEPFGTDPKTEEVKITVFFA